MLIQRLGTIGRGLWVGVVALVLTSAVGVSRSLAIDVYGCELTLDFDANARCLNNVIRRKMNEARNEVLADLAKANKSLAEANQRVSTLSDQLVDAKKNAIRAATEAARMEPFLAKTPWEKLALSEADRASTLFSCLGADRGWDIVALSNSMKDDPGRFAELQIRTAMKAVSDSFGTLMGEDLKSLAAGRVKQRTPHQQYAEGIRKFGVVARVAPGGRCLFEYAKPTLATAEGPIIAAVDGMKIEADRIVSRELLPALRSGIGKSLTPVFEELLKQTSEGALSAAGGVGGGAIEDRMTFLKGLTLSEEELKSIARGVLLRRKYKAMFESSSEAINALAGTLGQATGGPAATQAAAQRLLASVKGTSDWEKLCVVMGVEILRTVGHKYIDSKEPGHGGQLIESGVSLLQISKGTATEVVEAVVGEIPGGGPPVIAAVCEVVDVVWNGGVVPAISGVVSSEIHKGYDKAVTAVLAEVEKGTRLRDLKKRVDFANADLFLSAVPLEEMLYAWANDLVADDLEMLDGHFNSLKALGAAVD